MLSHLIFASVILTFSSIVSLGEEIQASGPEAQKDSRYPPAAHQARAGPHDQEDAKEVTPLLHAQICCQGLRLVFLNKIPHHHVLLFFWGFFYGNIFTFFMESI